MSITNDLSKILEIKEDIYNAISDKEVTIPDDTPFEEYASKISSIQTGGNCSILRINPTPSDATVAFTNSKGESIPNFYNQAACATGKTLGCTISKTGYKSFQNIYTMNQNEEISVSLGEYPYNFFGDAYGILCLTKSGELYGSGRANPNAHSGSDVVPYFSLIDTGVTECACYNGGYSYLKNETMYIHGFIYTQKNGVWYDGYTSFMTNVLSLCYSYGNSNHISYIDLNNDLYLMGQNNMGEQGYSGGNVYSPTKRASNVKKYCSLCSTASYYIDENNDMYCCGNGNIQGSGTNNNVYIFTKRASNVKEICAFRDGICAGYISNNNELYITSKSSQYNDYNWHKISDNVKSAYFIHTKNYGLIHYIDLDNNLYGYSLGDMKSPNPMGNGSSSGRAYNVLLASNVKSSTINGNTAAYLNTNGDLFASGSKDIFPNLTQDTNLFTKVCENVDVIYNSVHLDFMGDGTFLILKEDGGYYIAGVNSRGRLGIDNNETKVTEFTRIYPTGS